MKTIDGDSVNKNFYCQSATVHFIYSFSLVLDKKVGDEKKIDSYIVDPCTIVDLKEGKPSERRGISPHLMFNTCDTSYLELDDLKGHVDGLEVIINRIIRVFRNGCTCCISVQLPRNNKLYTNQDILNLLRLVNVRTRVSKQDGQLCLERDQTRKDIYDLFRDSVHELCESNCDDKKVISWLGEDQGLINTEVETQNPWVVTVAEVDGDVAKAFCGNDCDGDDPAQSKMLNIRKYQKDIVPILFRSVGDELRLEPAYLDPPTPSGIPGLYNMNLDHRLFVNMSRRSVLCICENKGVDPALYFLPGLLDICEMVRARWHMLIMMNKVLDVTLGGLRALMVNRRSLYSSHQVEEVMRLREWLATSLEDPAIYSIAGDALTKLHEELAITFQLGEIRRLVLDKLELLDKIYSDMQEFDWLQRDQFRRDK